MELILKMTEEHPDGEREEAVTVCFTEDEMATFKEYLECLEELEHCELVKEHAGVELNISFRDGKELEVSPHNLPINQVREFALLMRPFILHRERMSFNRVSGIVAREVKSVKLINALRNIRQIYDVSQVERAVVITSNNRRLFSDELVGNWLNGFVYHRDKKHQGEYRSAIGMLSADALEGFVLFAMFEKLHAVIILGRLLSVIVGELPSVHVNS